MLGTDWNHYRSYFPTVITYFSIFPNFLLCHFSSKVHKNRTNKERQSDCQSTWRHLVVLYFPTLPTPDTLKSTPQHTQNNNQTITTLTWLQERKALLCSCQYDVWKKITTSHPEILLFILHFYRIGSRWHILISIIYLELVLGLFVIQSILTVCVIWCPIVTHLSVLTLSSYRDFSCFSLVKTRGTGMLCFLWCFRC